MRLSYRTGMGIHEEKQRQMLAARDEIRMRRLARGTRGDPSRIDLAAFVRKARSALDWLDVRDGVRSIAHASTRGRGTKLRHQ